MPVLIATPFATNGTKNDIPETTGAQPQNATMADGFPAITQQPISTGGIPPERADFNGILYALSDNISHINKGLAYSFDTTFATKIGGYPLHAELAMADGTRVVSTIANNMNNPDVDMTGWRKGVLASDVFDESGLSQREINNLKADKAYVDSQDLLLQSQINQKAETGYVDNAISNLSTVASKFYPTLAEANADIANIVVNQPVTIGEAVNGGLWYKATLDSTTLTKSGYDPLQQSKNYTNDSVHDLVKFIDSKTNRVIDGGSVENLFEFSDSQGRPVVAIAKNGDIVNPDFSMNEIGGKSNIAYDFVKDAEKSNFQNTMKNLKIDNESNLYNFTDSKGSTVVSITSNGDIVFDGGVSIKDSLRIEKKDSFSSKEFIHESFNQAVLSGLAFNRTNNSYLFEGAFKQQFRIKNETDFLSLRISQGVAIDIDTPYFEKSVNPTQSSQVVHPFICTFKSHVHGFKHILLATPFHNTNDLYENPCVWGSNDLNEFTLIDKFEQPLSEFLPTGIKNYNSDNAAIFDHTTGEYVVLFRNSEYVGAGLYNRHYLLRTSDFINFSNPIKMLKEDGSDLSGSTLNLSPTVLFNPALNKWMMYQIEWDGAAQGLSYRTSDHLEYGWSQPLPISTSLGVYPWHCEVRYCGQHFIAILNDINGASSAVNGFGNLFIGISSDGINFTWSDSIFSGGFNNPYKATITHEIVGNSVKFHILWTSNGNDFAGWRLYHSETNLIEVV